MPSVRCLRAWTRHERSSRFPNPGRSLVLFTAADTLVSAVASGRSLRTTVPVSQRRMLVLLLRLGIPGSWIQARADDLATVHVARLGAETPDRRVLGSMNDLAVHVYALAQDAGTFDRIDLDHVEDRLDGVLLSALAAPPPARLRAPHRRRRRAGRHVASPASVPNRAGHVRASEWRAHGRHIVEG